ncbi:MAG: methylenetetrahydrofolate reductase [NAD(P)H] [Anaerolineae bacterium]|nr:methylenetetrahydrofolate reductase [NAD(P)H] [Anaerolineae bacterium]
MLVSEILNKNRPTFSFEFFPPKNAEASEELYQSIRMLAPLEPSFVTITYGAGGTTRELTRDLVMRLQRDNQLTVVSHLTAINATKDDIYSILQKYHDNNVMNIMALRGDPPRGATTFVPCENGFCNAADMVGFIKNKFPDLCVGVAGYPEGHPESRNRLVEMDHLKEKVDAGADYIITQLFFDNHDFFDYKERCELAGIRVPILPGILPITSHKSMMRMSDLAAGVRFPARLLKALSRTEDDETFARVGVHWATQQVLDLLHNDVRGVHFYTFNKSRYTLSIYDSLGLRTISKPFQS